MKDLIIHSGVGHDDNPPGRGSGRYGWGSGENPYQHQHNFLTEVAKYKKIGISQENIAKMLLGENANSSTLRKEIAIANANLRSVKRSIVIDVVEKCNGNRSEAARRLTEMGIPTDRGSNAWNESTVRSYLDEAINNHKLRYKNTADLMKKKIDESEYGVLDVGKNTEIYMGVTNNTKKIAIEMLEREGYVKSYVDVPQAANPNQKTSVMVLCSPKYRKENGKIDQQSIKEVVTTLNDDGTSKMATIQEFTPDKGKTWWTPEYPSSIDMDRVYVRYSEDGGKDKDGVIELRKGVEDISLGGSTYAQVRIAVNGTHYMKGMAMYGDIPEGYDIVYNTNKHKGTPALGDSDNTVLKILKDDKDNPFGATIKAPKEKDGILRAGGQRHYIDENGVERLSPINKISDEGDWDTWGRNLASQFLSKQPLKLINQQLNLTIADKKLELEDIQRLENPVIKKKLLNEFADQCDKNAVDLSAKGFRNQAFQVLLPIPSMKENEIYAPNYKDGDTVALIRYPHGGIFEIPILKVNNKQKDAIKVMGNAKDAVGINNKTAEILSGADFDGDTALVIPLASNKIKVNSMPQLEALKGFEPKERYKLPDEAPKITNRTKQIEMGKVTNLIQDMSISSEGVSLTDLSKAVKHSMVVIDSEKHHLDYKQSEIDNNIIALKKKYQGVNKKGQPNGASTIITRAGNEKAVNQRKEITDTKKMTKEQLKSFNAGNKVYIETGKERYKRITDPRKMTQEEIETRYNLGKKVWRDTGKLVQEKIPQMDLVDDAMDLVQDIYNPKEVAYAKYANNLKDLARTARKEARNIKPIPVSQTAKKTYEKEVNSLARKLKNAEMNDPKERTATTIAYAISQEKINADPSMDYEHQQRVRAQSMIQARSIVGAKKDLVNIEPKEWEAIQANAITTTMLTKILNNTDQDKFKKLATPKKDNKSLTNAQIGLIEAMLSSGRYTQAEIADRLGVSKSTISKYINS